MQKLISYFFFDFNLKFQTTWFKRLLYIFALVKCIYLLAYYDVLFGSASVFYAKPYLIKTFKDLGFLLYASTNKGAALYFIIPALLIALFNLAYPKLYFITDLILWFLVINLHNKAYASLTGGDYLLNQFLFFNCFLSACFILRAGRWQALKTALHNFGIVAVMAQVVIVYALSGLAKLNDPAWLSGEAVLLVAGVNHFSLPLLARLSQNSAFVFVLLNYAVLFYQCAFPFLVWFKKIKKPFIIVGILMHLYIAFVMGLVSFGLIMIIAYVYFWPVATRLNTEAQGH